MAADIDIGAELAVKEMKLMKLQKRMNLMWSKDFKLSGILSEVLSDEDCVRRVLLKSQMFLIMSRILFQIISYKETS